MSVSLLKRQAAITMLLAGVLLPIHGQEKGSKRAENQESTAPAIQTLPPNTNNPNIVVSVVNQPTANAQANGAEDHPHGYLSKLVAPETLAQFGLVFVGIVAGWLAWRSLQTLQHQATSARIAAESALKQANYLAASERAWVTEKINFPDKISRPTMDAGVLAVAYTFKNAGRQPALVRNIQTRFHIPNGQLPDVPEYRAGTLIPPPEIGSNGKLMAPNEEIILLAFLEEGMLLNTQVTDIEEGRNRLFTYALVTYEVFGEKKITQCCYQWKTLQGLTFGTESSGFRRGGPPTYNQST